MISHHVTATFRKICLQIGGEIHKHFVAEPSNVHVRKKYENHRGNYDFLRFDEENVKEASDSAINA